jgi:hypothetical protein
MLPEIAASFVASISALSSIVKAIKDVRTVSGAIFEAADEIARKTNKSNGSVLALAATVIDGDLIVIATENIERALDRLKKDLRDPTVTQAGKDAAVRDAGFLICNELSRVKRLNGGVLPGDDRFHELWSSHGCA